MYCGKCLKECEVITRLEKEGYGPGGFNHWVEIQESSCCEAEVINEAERESRLWALEESE
jgi:hypothetical protein